jgi:quinol monooxygenase YgiN
MRSSDQFTVLTQIIAKPGRETAVRDALLDSVGPTRAELGNTRYDVHQLETNAAAFYVLQEWANQAAWDAFRATSTVSTVLTERKRSDLVAPPMQSRARMLSNPDVRPDKPRPTTKSSTQVTLVPFFAVRKGEVDRVRDAHLSMVQPTRAEPGCLDYDLYESLDGLSVMFFYENWTDAEALRRHMNTPNFYRLVRGEIDSRLVVPWTALTMKMLSEPASS